MSLSRLRASGSGPQKIVTKVSRHSGDNLGTPCGHSGAQGLKGPETLRFSETHCRTLPRMLRAQASCRGSGMSQLWKFSRKILKTPFFSPPPSLQCLETQILWTANFVDISISPKSSSPVLSKGIAQQSRRDAICFKWDSLQICECNKQRHGVVAPCWGNAKQTEKVFSKVPEGHNPRGTTLRDALRGDLPLRAQRPRLGCLRG